MLRPHDLRLGNWILDRGIPVQVSMLSIGMNFYCINGVNLDKKTGLTLDEKKEDRFGGIELTVDALKTIGYDRDPHEGDMIWFPNDTKFKYKMALLNIDDGGAEFILNRDGTPVKSLHQLMNLYKENTLQELTYHPSTLSEKTE